MFFYILKKCKNYCLAKELFNGSEVIILKRCNIDNVLSFLLKICRRDP